MVSGFGTLTLGLAVASLAASAGGVWVSIRVAHHAGVIDVPNERSSHAVPTPRMGGVPMVGVAALIFTFWACLVAIEVPSIKVLSYVMPFAVAMSILGFWDDLSGLSPHFRFLVQIATAILSLWAWSTMHVLWVLVGAFWIVWMLNLYNFMDGIDGLAGGEAAVASSFFFLIFSYFGETGWAAANLFIAAASMGFLVHNWPPARVFMGDAGSSFLGAFYGMQSIAAALSTPVPFPVLVLPFFNFIMDTTVTLLRRMWRGEKWYHAHRSHIYQRMTDIGMSHKKVTSLELSLVAASCAVAAAYIHAGYYARIALMGVVIVALAGTGYWVHRKERAI